MKNFEGSNFAARLRKEIQGDVHFDALSRARYATDASRYQIMPAGVVLPKTEADIAITARLAAAENIPLVPRGAGTSSAGQTVSEGLIVDFSKYLNQLHFYDLRSMTCAVQPGMTLGALNAELMPHGVWFPVNVGPRSQSTFGGLCGNNALGPRALRYGAMRDNISAIDAVLADGSEMCFGEIREDAFSGHSGEDEDDLAFELLQIGERYESVIREAMADRPRLTSGYHLGSLLPEAGAHNLAPLLIGSEGTLALSKRIELTIQPLPRNWALGICHFDSLRQALRCVAPITALKPSVIDLIEADALRLAGADPRHAKTVERCLRGGGGHTLLVVEFGEDNQVENAKRLKTLTEIIRKEGGSRGFVEAVGAEMQHAIWEARDAAHQALTRRFGGTGLPFLDDCTLPFGELMYFTSRVAERFREHNIACSWTGFALEDAMSLRPFYKGDANLSRAAIRALAEEMTLVVRKSKGALAAGRGSGLARSEFNDVNHGRAAMAVFEEIKALLDPEGRLNPGKVVFAPRADDPLLKRGGIGGDAPAVTPALQWPETPGGNPVLAMAGSCDGAGLCRKLEGGGMCPAFRITRDESHSPRGMANSVRAALTGDAAGTWGSKELADAFRYCVSCKACQSECPMGVDIARLKIEVLAASTQRNGLATADKIFAYLPHYAAALRRVRWVLALRDAIPPLARASEMLTGISAGRALPRWRGKRFRAEEQGPADGRPVVLFGDTFNLNFEPDNLRSAAEVLAAAGYRVSHLAAPQGERPICCGRTFLSAGLVDKARIEAERFLKAAAPHLEAGTPIVGLEPACISTVRDEFFSLLPREDAAKLSRQISLFEEFIMREHGEGRFAAPLKPVEAKALLHGHCHQKAAGAMDAVRGALSLIPGLEVADIETGCCGMAGGFGYSRETMEISLAMGEAALFPAIRAADRDTLLVADGFSCRQQIRDGTGRTCRHAAGLFKLSINTK